MSGRAVATASPEPARRATWLSGATAKRTSLRRDHRVEDREAEHREPDARLGLARAIDVLAVEQRLGDAARATARAGGAVFAGPAFGSSALIAHLARAGGGRTLPVTTSAGAAFGWAGRRS